jgi:NADH:ubiquinone oxidoreductase subunit 6 (subunit J)
MRLSSSSNRGRAVLAALALVGAVLALPEAVASCPNCGPADAKSRGAYRAATGLLVSLPLLLMIAGGIWGARIARRSRATRDGGPDGERAAR